MATLISANADISWARSAADVRLLQVMSNGHYLVIYKNTGTGILNYRTSPDSGATWTAAIVMPGSPTEAGLWAVHVISDVLYIWYGGASIRLYKSTYNTGTNTLGAQTLYTYTFAGITNYPVLDTVYFDGAWHVTFWSVKGGVNSIGLFRTPGFDGTLSTTQQFVDLNYIHTGISGLTILAVSGQLHIAWYDTSRNELRFAPVTLGASSYSYLTSNLELATTLTDSAATFTMIEEISGSQTFVLAQSTLLYSLVRTGLNSYGSPVALNAQIAASQVPAAVLDSTDLYVGYQTEINQPNGESYLLKRTGSRWTLPIILAGGSSAGFQAPILALNAALYQDTSNNLWFVPWASSGAPLAPTNLAPVGNISTLTPHLTWRSNRSAPGDPPGQQQIQTLRVSDNHVMDDSGSIAWTGSYDEPGGAGLVYGTAYKFQVREKDTLSALGAGTWGPYSTFATFTPQQGATVVVTKVTSGGTPYTVFPATIGANDTQAHVTYNQASSDATNAYKMLLYAADDTTVLDTTAIQTLGPPVASGGSFDTIDWESAAIANGGTFHFSVMTADAVTGVWSESPHVELIISYTPPPSPTSLIVTTQPDSGTVTLNWANPGAAVSVLLEWQPYTESGKPLGWRQLGPSGQLWNQVVTLAQAPQLYADYRVTIFDSLGLASAPETATGVFLDNALDYASIWLNDVNDVLNRKVYLGYVDNWDSLKRDRAYQMEEWTPMGAELPVQTFGLQKYWIIGTSNALKIFLPSQELDLMGGVHYGADNRDMCISMSDLHNVVLYRDRRFPVPIYVKFVAYEDQPNEDINTDMTLELHHTSYFAPFPVVGSLL